MVLTPPSSANSTPKGLTDFVDSSRKLQGLSLFSGIGGLDLALAEWVKPVVYCERERFCHAMLFERMARGKLPTAPLWDDVRTLTRAHINAQIDIIYGGFPCQDISVAGAGKGLAGERSGLFYQIARLISQLRPRFIYLENVPAITCRGGQEVVAVLTRLGYDCRWCVISAASVGAPHLRKRWFLLAHPNGAGLQASGPKQQAAGVEQRSDVAYSNGAGQPPAGAEQQTAGAERRGYVAYPESVGPQGLRASGEQKPGTPSGSLPVMWGGKSRSDLWATEPDVGRVVDGFPGRVDQIKSLGNSVVPEQAREAFKLLIADKR